MYVRNEKAPIRNGRYGCCNDVATWKKLRHIDAFHIASNVIVCLRCGERKLIDIKMSGE